MYIAIGRHDDESGVPGMQLAVCNLEAAAPVSIASLFDRLRIAHHPGRTLSISPQLG